MPAERLPPITLPSFGPGPPMWGGGVAPLNTPMPLEIA